MKTSAGSIHKLEDWLSYKNRLYYAIILRKYPYRKHILIWHEGPSDKFKHSKCSAFQSSHRSPLLPLLQSRYRNEGGGINGCGTVGQSGIAGEGKLGGLRSGWGWSEKGAEGAVTYTDVAWFGFMDAVDSTSASLDSTKLADFGSHTHLDFPFSRAFTSLSSWMMGLQLLCLPLRTSS